MMELVGDGIPLLRNRRGVSITLIATGFKRQEDRKGKASLFSLYLFPTFWSQF
ncbi:hypothetical protein Gotur_035845, partial [Gossypium turneri]